jgi:hypothetical protein
VETPEKGVLEGTLTLGAGASALASSQRRKSCWCVVVAEKGTADPNDACGRGASRVGSSYACAAGGRGSAG